MSARHKDHELSPLERLPPKIPNRISTLAVRKDAFVELRLATRQIPLAATNKNLREQVLPIFYGINTFVLNTTDKDYGVAFDARVKAFVDRWGKYLKFMKRFGAYSPDTFYCFNAEPQTVPRDLNTRQSGYKLRPPRHHVDHDGNSVSISGNCDLTRVHIVINEDATVQVDFSSLGQALVLPCVCRIKHASSSGNQSDMPGMHVARLMLAAVDDLAPATKQILNIIRDDDLRDAVHQELKIDETVGDCRIMEARDRAWATGGCDNCKEFRVCVTYDGHGEQLR